MVAGLQIDVDAQIGGGGKLKCMTDCIKGGTRVGAGLLGRSGMGGGEDVSNSGKDGVGVVDGSEDGGGEGEEDEGAVHVNECEVVDETKLDRPESRLYRLE